MNRIAFVLFSLTIFVQSCRNDLDIIAPQEEVMIVYAVLNGFDSTHYVKVNKGFASDEKSPIILAQDPDLLFYDSLKVTLINKSLGTEFPLSKFSISKNPNDNNGNPGKFTTAVNYIYAANFRLITGHEYEVLVENPISGKTARSIVRVVSNPSPRSPNQQNIDIYPIEPDKFITLNYDADQLAFSYEVRLNFIYEERNNSTNEVLTDTIPWIMASGKFNDQKRILLRTEGKLFYDNISNNLVQKGPEVTRRGIAIEFEYWSGDKELTTYIDVYGTSSIGVVQKKSDYTNIAGGYGLFASRNVFKISGTKLDPRISYQLKSNPDLTRFRFSG